MRQVIVLIGLYRYVEYEFIMRMRINEINRVVFIHDTFGAPNFDKFLSHSIDLIFGWRAALWNAEKPVVFGKARQI